MATEVVEREGEREREANTRQALHNPTGDIPFVELGLLEGVVVHALSHLSQVAKKMLLGGFLPFFVAFVALLSDILCGKS